MTIALHRPATDTAVHARLYLDVNGVILANQPSWGDAKSVQFRVGSTAHRVTYSPHLIHALDRLWFTQGTEVVIVSDWTHLGAFDLLAEEIGAFQYARKLTPTDPTVDHWKRDAIAVDLASSPAPFLWVGETDNTGDVIHIAAAVDQPALTLTPNPLRGLTSADLTSIERFVAQRHPRRLAA